MASERAFDVTFDTAQRLLSVVPTRRQAMEHVEEQIQHGANPEFWGRVLEYLKVLPSASRMNGVVESRTCSKCDKVITGAEWEHLPLLGYQVIPAFEEEPGEVLELKNHSCGSTLARMAPFSPEALEAGAQREMKSGVDLKRARQIAANHLENNPMYYG